MCGRRRAHRKRSKPTSIPPMPQVFSQSLSSSWAKLLPSLGDCEELLVPTGRLSAPSHTGGFSSSEAASAQPPLLTRSHQKKKEACRHKQVTEFYPNREKLNEVKHLECMKEKIFRFWASLIDSCKVKLGCREFFFTSDMEALLQSKHFCSLKKTFGA